jgi:hypothetical protein
VLNFPNQCENATVPPPIVVVPNEQQINRLLPRS